MKINILCLAENGFSLLKSKKKKRALYILKAINDKQIEIQHTIYFQAKIWK